MSAAVMRRQDLDILVRPPAVRFLVLDAKIRKVDLVIEVRQVVCAWFRELFERASVEHQLHFVDASDDRCKRQLKDRSRNLPPGTPWTTDADFEAITVYFQAPAEEEGFNVVRHQRP